MAVPSYPSTESCTDCSLVLCRRRGGATARADRHQGQCRNPQLAVNRPMCDERDGCECSSSVRACARTTGDDVAYRSSRKRVALAFAVLVSAVLLGGCDWTMYRSGAAHTGASPGETVVGTSNVASLSEAWSTPSAVPLAHWGDGTGPPVVAGGRVYAQREDGFLSVYDAQGIGNCGGSPTECLPLWQAQVEEGPGDHDGGPGIPAVAGGVAYVAHGRFDDGVLSAFDAAGTGCSGSPPTCQPLWTTRLGAGFVAPPTVAGGIVYVTGINDFANVLFAFDATGQQGCTGTPTVCAPLWTATFGPRTPFGDPGARSPTVASGRVFVSGAGHTVYVFDAAGQQNCDGTPKECSELWTAAVPLACDAPYIVCGISAPAVARGVLYVTGREGGFTGGLFAFDANGTSSCSESPKQCSPLWTSNTAATRYPPAIGDGAVYTVAFSPSGIYRLRAFDATGTQGCTGTPKICEPLWTSTTEGFTGAPTAANGVVYAVGLSPELAIPSARRPGTFTPSTVRASRDAREHRSSALRSWMRRAPKASRPTPIPSSRMEFSTLATDCLSRRCSVMTSGWCTHTGCSARERSAGRALGLGHIWPPIGTAAPRSGAKSVASLTRVDAGTRSVVLHRARSGSRRRCAWSDAKRPNGCRAPHLHTA